MKARSIKTKNNNNKESTYTASTSIPRNRSKSSHLCPGLNANEIQIPYDKHHKVSSLVKSRQNTHNSVKYEVI